MPQALLRPREQLELLCALSQRKATPAGNSAVVPEICYPTRFAVTSTEAYGNEISTFSAFQGSRKSLNPLILLGFQKLARHLLYVWYKNNNKHCNP